VRWCRAVVSCAEDAGHVVDQADPRPELEGDVAGVAATEMEVVEAGQVVKECSRSMDSGGGDRGAAANWAIPVPTTVAMAK